MSDPYEEIRALRARLARIEAAAGMIEVPRTYTSAELSDREFFKANEADILRAAREPGTPRIVESEPEAPVRAEYPPTGHAGLVQRGPGIFEETGDKQ